MLHSSFGIYIAEKVFGINLTNSEGKLVSVRDVAEQHVIDDMGRIPTVQDYLVEMPFYNWLGGKKKEVTQVPFETVVTYRTQEELKAVVDEYRRLRREQSNPNDVVD